MSKKIIFGSTSYQLLDLRDEISESSDFEDFRNLMSQKGVRVVQDEGIGQLYATLKAFPGAGLVQPIEFLQAKSLADLLTLGWLPDKTPEEVGGFYVNIFQLRDQSLWRKNKTLLGKPNGKVAEFNFGQWGTNYNLISREDGILLTVSASQILASRWLAFFPKEIADSIVQEIINAPEK